VAASPGVIGGYQLRPGRDMPPLLLDEDEALAVAVGLRCSAAGVLAGMEESALRALAKLDQLMSKRVRARVAALGDAIAALPRQATPVDHDVLIVLAAACRDRERLRFDYVDHDGVATERVVEPHRVLHDGRRWHLVAWNGARADWRTFRIDRLRPRLPAGPRFAPRPTPRTLIADIERGLARATWKFRARVIVHAPAAALAARVPKAVTVEPRDARSCVAHVGADDPAALAMYLAMLDADFEVVDAPELRAGLRALARRLRRAAAAQPR
jgi:predicted DNA-binding transcriptional regulator YafY